MTTILHHSRYNPARGGHAPGDLRDAFCEAIEAMRLWDGNGPEPTVELRDRSVAVSEVCGLLWNCSDVMSSLDCRAMGYVVDGFQDSGATYAQGARALRD